MNHSFPLVLLSIAIALVASYAALVLTGRVAAAHGRARRRWLVGGAVAMGTGIWCMHFVAMLAERLPVAITHQARGLLVSLLVAIGASALALYVASRPVLGSRRLALAGLVMGGGIASMHYIGMAGLVTAARVQYHPGRVLASFLVAVFASLAALWLAFHLRDRDGGPPLGWRRAIATMVMGSAIAGMHYTGMSAARFTPAGPPAPAGRSMMLDGGGLTVAVVAVTGALLLLALFAARVDRGSRTEAARILERITDGFLALDPEGYCTYANRAAELLLGHPRQALIGRRLRDFVPGDSALERACREAMAEQATVEAEELVAALGRWLAMHVYPSANGLSVYFHDVTARRDADEALRRREHQLADAQRIAHVGSWEWIVATDQVAWSEELYRIYGLEPGSFVPTFERYVERVHPADRNNTVAALRRALASGGVFAFQERIVRPDGEVRVLHSQGQALLDAGGTPVRITGTCQDVTERTVAEQRLRQANRMVDAVVHASPLPVIAVDTTRRVTLWNPAAERAFGWTAGEVLGTVNPLVPNGEVGALRQILERPGPASGIALHQVQRRRKDGTTAEVSISAAPLYDPDGELMGAVAMIVDVTEQRAASAALRASEERFRELAEHVREVFWILSPEEGRLLYVSPAVEQVWGVAPAALLADPGLVTACIHPDDRPHAARALTEVERDGNEVEYRVVRPDGEVRWIRGRAFPVRDAAGATVRIVGVADDVTARKRDEETVRANERQARKMAERMRAVAAAAGATLGAQTPEALRDVLVEAARRVLPHDAFALALLEAGGATLGYLGAYDAGVCGPGMAVALAGTPAERVIRGRQSLLTRSSGDPASRGGKVWGTGRRSESAIRTPVLSGEQVLGMLTVQSYTPDAYDGDDVEVLEALAALASSALRNIALRAEQDAAEEALRQSERDYRGLFENAHDAIIILDPRDERVLDVNARACRLYGYPREQFVGMSMEAISVNVAGGREMVRQTMEPGVPLQFELEQRGAGGERLYVEITATPIPYRGGHAILSINRDIGERKRTEEALRASELKFRSVTQSAVDAIVTIDAEDRIVSWNRGAEAVFGYTEAESLDQPLERVLPERFRARHRRGVQRLMAATDAAPQGSVVEFVGLRRDGTEFPLELSLALWEAGGRRFATGIIRDITERRQAEEALRQSREQLAQAQKMEAVGRLAGGVAHDFNNLLTAIGGNAALAKLDRESDVELGEHLGEITAAADRAAGLTRQLLAFSRQQVLQPRLLDLNAVVSGMHRMLSRLIGEHVDVVLKLHGALPSVKADPTQIEQVILNLVVNARDAMPEGGQMVVRTGSLELPRPEPRAGFVLPAGSYAVLSVVDTGCGMSEATLSRVFEPFFTTKPEGRGTGLGLSTVFGIVKQTGGFIEVTSEPGSGSRFDIFLPSVPSAADPNAENAPAPLPTGSGTVLLVEDDDAVRLVGTRALLRSGFTVLTAADGEQGVQVAAAHGGGIDLVVTDVVMPRMGGRELARRLAETHPGTRVLFTSGFMEDAMLRPETFEPGTYFLAKPFAPGDLVRQVMEVLSAP